MMDFWKFWKPYFWRSILTLLGLAAAVLFITLGFFRTLLILFLCCVGCVFGTLIDKGVLLTAWVWFRRNRRR